MTEDQWLNAHPAQCTAYLEAWTDKQRRRVQEAATLQLTICAAQGVKINGRKPKLDDFLPEFAKLKRKPKPKTDAQREAALKAGLASIATNKTA